MKREYFERYRLRRASLLIVAGVLVTGLVGCGGGGSSSSTRTPVDPVVDPVVDPTFNPLTEGTKDPLYINDDGITDDRLTLTFGSGINLLHQRLEGPRPAPDRSIGLRTPPTDIRQAWKNGWTGQGVNVFIMDNFGVDGAVGTTSFLGTHGYTVMMSAREYAPRANFYALQGELNRMDLDYGDGGVRDVFRNAGGHESVAVHVINWSIGTLPVPTDPFDPDYLTDAEIREEAVGIPDDDRYWYDFQDIIGTGNILQNARDAVITKVAGNEDRADAGRVVENLALVLSDVAKSRALIVGALDKYAQDPDGDAALADYSNIAGDFTEVQQRFLVEYGGSPYGEDAYLCSDKHMSCQNDGLLTIDEGTSFAAPRVAGHAALVRHKFPNLSGAQTASILLDTATYEGLVCAPNCPVREYGQGRVDIGSALAPIGPLQ